MKLALTLAILVLGGWSFGVPGGLGLAASFLLMAHFSHPGAGLAAVCVCATAPAFYVQGSASLDPPAALAPLAVASLGLALAALLPLGCCTRWMAAGVGLLGASAGFLRLGALFGVVLPALAVALTWALGSRPREGRGVALSAFAAAALSLSLEPFGVRDGARGLARLGFAVAGQGRSPTFEAAIGQLARSSFPWSALLPCALAALTELPRRGAAPVETGALERESALRLLLSIGTALSYGLVTFSTADPAATSIAGLPFAAASIGLWLWDVARGSRVSPIGGLVAALLAGLLAADVVRLPSARVAAFAPGAASAREAEGPLAGDPAPTWVLASAALTSGGALVAGLESSVGARRSLARAARTIGPVRALRGRRRPRRRGVRRLRFALCAGALLGALVLRAAYRPAAIPDQRMALAPCAARCWTAAP